MWLLHIKIEDGKTDAEFDRKEKGRKVEHDAVALES
jgi:hypothetical protein